MIGVLCRWCILDWRATSSTSSLSDKRMARERWSPYTSRAASLWPALSSPDSRWATWCIAYITHSIHFVTPNNCISQLFALAVSLGAVESLACSPAIMTHASVPQADRERVGLTDGLVRLSIGSFPSYKHIPPLFMASYWTVWDYVERLDIHE